MALPATDAFTGANGTALQTYSANWTIRNGGFNLLNNGITPAAAGSECAAYWNADTPNNDQYAQIVFKANGSGAYVGVAVRIATGANSYYVAYTNGSTVFFAKVITGTYTDLTAQVSGAWTAGDIMKITAIGNAITLYKNGGQIATATDSVLASGMVGVGGFGAGATANADDWEGGNTGGAAAAIVPAWFVRRPRIMIDRWR